LLSNQNGGILIEYKPGDIIFDKTVYGPAELRLEPLEFEQGRGQYGYLILKKWSVLGSALMTSDFRGFGKFRFTIYEKGKVVFDRAIYCSLAILYSIGDWKGKFDKRITSRRAIFLAGRSVGLEADVAAHKTTPRRLVITVASKDEE
jgi:hypothetical protein